MYKTVNVSRSVYISTNLRYLQLLIQTLRTYIFTYVRDGGRACTAFKMILIFFSSNQSVSVFACRFGDSRISPLPGTAVTSDCGAHKRQTAILPFPAVNLASVFHVTCNKFTARVKRLLFGETNWRSQCSTAGRRRTGSPAIIFITSRCHGLLDTAGRGRTLTE